MSVMFPQKLNPELQLEVCKRIAWYWRLKDIVTWLQEEHKIKLSYDRVWLYQNSHKWKPVIREFRETYLTTVSDVPLANKKKRLEELQKHYDNALDKDLSNQAIRIIRECREEMQEKVADVSYNFTQINHTEFHNMSDEDIKKEKMKTFEELEKVNRLKQLTCQGDTNAKGT